MEHKAFVFEYEPFENELKEFLEDALATGEDGRLKGFIRSNHLVLKDPYEGEPLKSDWESLLEVHDAHQYGDFALTKYYLPESDVGLGREWEEAQVYLDRAMDVGNVVLGSPIGPPENPFDPGKMGSYFQSEDDVKENLKTLTSLTVHEAPKALSDWQGTVRRAAESDKGLYITF